MSRWCFAALALLAAAMPATGCDFQDNDRRQHIHALIRTLNGNDYGKDLLRQHYAQHSHR